MTIRSLALLEADVRKRVDTDKQMSFGVYFALFLVLSWFASIWGWITGYQLFERRNRHLERQHQLLKDALQCFRELAQARNVTTLDFDFDNVEHLLRDSEIAERPRDPLVWGVIFPILTLGLIYFLTFYWLMNDYRQHWLRQKEIAASFDKIGRELGIVKTALVDESEVPERNYLAYVLLTIITLFIFAVYWWYVVFRDANEHFVRQAYFEDDLLNALRSAA